MKYRYCIGEGNPPLFVRDIQDYREKKVIIEGNNKEILQDIYESEFAIFLKGKKKNELTFVLSSAEDLQKLCLWLIRKCVCFSVGGMSSWGPAAVVRGLRNADAISETFLEISWRGPKKWQIHEIGLGEIQEWEKTSVENLLGARNNEQNRTRV